MGTALRKLKQHIPVWCLIAVPVVLLASLAFVFAFREPAPGKVLRIGMRQFEPYLLSKPDGSPDGVTVAILNEAARRRGIRLQWLLHTEGPDKALESGQVDLWPMLEDEPRRYGKVHVSRPWMVREFVLLALKNSGLKRVSQVAGKRVAFVYRPYTAMFVATHLPGVQGVGLGTIDDAVRAVCTEKADAAFLDLRLVQSMLTERPLECRNSALQYTFVKDAMIPWGVGSTLQHARHADLLANEIMSMGNDGTLAVLLTEWSVLGAHDAERLSVLARLEDNQRYLIYGIGVMFLLIVALAILARRLNSARQVASRAVQVKAALLTNVGHEIRTPMNGVMGMTNLLFTTDLTDTQREYAEAAQSSAESLLELLNNMLDYARMDQGKLVFENVDFDLHGLLEDVAEHYGPGAARKRLELACLIGPNTPQIVKGDAMKLRQVLNNLMSNALKFTSHGDIVLSARVVTEDDTGVVLQLEVSDTGIGISEQDRSKLFRTFSQLDDPESRSHSGTGLGLAICKQIITGAGGYMDYHSRPGEGSSFWIIMRFGRAKFEMPPATTDQTLDGRTVLIVHASKQVRKMIRNQCRVAGVTTAEAANCPEALGMLQTATFDVIIGDHDGPGMLQVADAKPAATKLILLASSHTDESVNNWSANEAAINAMLSKPVRQNALSYTLRDVLTQRAEESISDFGLVHANSQPVTTSP